MSKGERNRGIRRQALAIKQDHPSDPRTTKQIARRIRRHGSPVGGAMREVWKPGWREGGMMSTIKSKIRRK